MKKIQTKQQRRAAFALKEIENLLNKDRGVSSELATFIVGMPNMILSNGLGQTLAFLLSKKENKQKTVFDILQRWLVKENKSLETTSEIIFLKKFTELSQCEYLTAQKESLKLLEWLKRYARAFEKKEENNASIQ